jgi:hypothetical protein
MRHTISVSTFYFDVVEESFKSLASRFVLRQGGVSFPYTDFELMV